MSCQLPIDKRELSKNVIWDAIVITISVPKWRSSIRTECSKWTKAGLIPSHKFLLIIEDPQPSLNSSFQSFGVGSGGATLNGLLVIAERLSALAGYTTINSEVLKNSLILMVHLGRSSHHLIGGNAFVPISIEGSWIPPSLKCPLPPVLLLNSLWMATVLASRSISGVWLPSVDFFLQFINTVNIPDTSLTAGAIICSLTSSKDKMMFPHGIVSTNPSRIIENITYVNPFEHLEKYNEKQYNIISGSTFVSTGLAEVLLGFHTLPPLDRCTYYGTDCDSEPVQISLYFDLLLPLCILVTEMQYISGEAGIHYAERANYGPASLEEGKKGRRNIWNQLHGKFVAFEHPLQVHDFIFLHPNMTSKLAIIPALKTLENIKPRRSFALQSSSSNIFMYRSIVLSSVRNEENGKMYIINSHIGSHFALETKGESIIVNFQFADANNVIKLGKDLIWQIWPLYSGLPVLSCHGFHDQITVDFEDKDFSIFNHSCEEFFSTFNLDSTDIWDHSQYPRNFLNAKLFCYETSLIDQLKMFEILTLQNKLHTKETEKIIEKFKSMRRISLKQILNDFDLGTMLNCQDNILLDLMKLHTTYNAVQINESSLLPLLSYVSAMSPDATMSFLCHLHNIFDSNSSPSSLILAHIADLLGCLGGIEGGLRSGPASNREWIPALLALKQGDYKEGIQKLLSMCKIFVASGRPEDIIRASRHYERASQIIISKMVETANEQVFPLYKRFESLRCLSVGVWVTACCPARLDLAGGWTDTPPICYEQGGAVLNIAVKVNGKKPIGAKCRLIPSLKIICVLKDVAGFEHRFEWNSLEQLRDYDNPVSCGALIKAVLVYVDFISLTSESSLSEQLTERYNAGLEIIVWSDMPQGSGLGGSSLLAGVILGSLGVLMGYPLPNTHQIIHAVLGIEQMLTTGGGWQDQVGGLIGGLKLGVSQQKIPLIIQTYTIPLTKEFLDFLNSRLLLLYTGQVRLARNLLQTVIRNWYSRETKFTQSFSQLKRLAFEASAAALDGNYCKLGDCINQYWELKKAVASGCEPSMVADIMNVLKDSLLGQSLAGAGGGGYLYGLARDPLHIESPNSVYRLLAEKFPQMPIEKVEVDIDGLTIKVEEQPLMVVELTNIELTKPLLNDIIQNS